MSQVDFFCAYFDCGDTQYIWSYKLLFAWHSVIYQMCSKYVQTCKRHKLHAKYTFLFAWIFTKNEHSSRGHSLNLTNDVMKSHCCLEKPWKNKKFSRIIYHRQSNHYNWWSKNTFWEQSTFFLPSGWEMSGSIFNPFFIKETNPFFIRETFLLINMTWAWHIDF